MNDLEKWYLTKNKYFGQGQQNETPGPPLFVNFFGTKQAFGKSKLNARLQGITNSANNDFYF